ncbi:PREDICTED: putative nuclease HARBI1 isoform X2 [Rhagoletis zephyria]|uniref:putative nuclease HARBI1 isoform X2 n=1 Tax=Rhagoletis zephyria TaxID=28612 RepID=UPI0008119C15|nr:PREDICTED: putative nuclease HARBI1 isoform X2 [Rhagoletis zephyria]
MCNSIFEEIRPHMREMAANGLPKRLRFLATLRFFAQGSYQRSVGQDFLLNISQSSVSRCVREVANIIDKHLLAKYVKFPSSAEDIQAVKEIFYREFRFPGVIGAIDGSHINIKKPSKDIEHVYVCRKGGHSINVQVIVMQDSVELLTMLQYGEREHLRFCWIINTQMVNEIFGCWVTADTRSFLS